MVVTGWTVIFITLSLTKLKQHRCSGGLYSMETGLMHKQKWIMRAFVAVYIIVAWLISRSVYFPVFDEIKNNPRIAIIVDGAIVFLLAIVIYIPSRFAITSNCTWKGVFKRGRDKLITRGPYKYIRHPHYIAYFTAGIATGLILTDSSILVFMLLLVPMGYLKAHIEEQYLASIFPEYKEYKKKTGMFL